jgi:hypothetical protein
MAEGRLSLQALALPAAAIGVLPPGTKAFTLGECRVFVSRDEIGDRIVTGRWHLSISHASRYPTWDEIVEARDRLLPDDLYFCMGLPPRERWLSVHAHCFHLWEMRDTVLVEQWDHEGRSVQGTPFGGHKPRDL